MTNTNNVELFHDGDIQSGIATALQEDKCVVCFIQDETEESEQWLAWIKDHHIPSQLQKNAITLRLQAGSAEANAFNAFSPIPRTPMVSIIYNGAVTEQIVLGTTKNEFTLRLLRAISPSQRSKTASSTHAQQPAPSSPLPPLPSQTPAASQTTQETAQTSTASSEAIRSSPISNKAKGKQRAEEDKKPNETPEEKNAKPGKPYSEAQKYARQNVERKKEMVAERERVRALVENDKKERKMREERRKAERSSAPAISDIPTPQPSTAGSTSDVCAVRVRLLDGTTMTSSFQARGKLSSTVRPWIIKDRTDGNLPFKFKQILTPLPSKTIQPEDEDKTLAELGLTPSANLILVPLKKVASAYSYGTLGTAQAFFAKIYALLASIILTLVNFITRIFGAAPSSPSQHRQRPAQAAAGGSDPADKAETTQSERSSTSNGSTIRVRTLADQRKGQTEDQQLYNGNQLNFEPQKDDDDKDE